MRSTQRDTSWITEAVRRREADLADACATAATFVTDPLAASALARLVFEHLRHGRPHLECTAGWGGDVNGAVLRARARRAYAVADRPLAAAIDAAVVGAIARAHAELALFVDEACTSLLVTPVERDLLMRVASCTAAMGDQLGR